MDEEESEFCPFVQFTRESLFNIESRILEEAAAKAAKDAGSDSEEEEEPAHVEPLKPNPKLEVGKKLPPSLEDFFPSEYAGKPLEDIDEYYQNQKTFCVVGKDKSIFRFSATNAFYLLSPFNPVRRAAIYILVHPLFSALVILTILVNCIFMCFTVTPGGDTTEYVFTAIYTIEACTKMLARGFIIHSFTYLRDPWNWLDFGVIGIAYVTMFIPLGNLSALRTFRVLRALKTVAVIPGLKTIVGALLEAVIRLRDVGILTSFVLSIFALIGMQLYMGSLRNRCVLMWDREIGTWNFSEDDYEWKYEGNWTQEEIDIYSQNETNWYPHEPEYLICGHNSLAGKCPPNYTCLDERHLNPNFGYTNFDHFGWALLCAFRLMTQDYWENLYMLILRAEGQYHCIYFILVILMGSFYLINLILAIVAMSYDEQQKQDKADAEEEAAERQQEDDRKKEEFDIIQGEIQEILSQQMTKSPSSDLSLTFANEKGDDKDRISIQSEKPPLEDMYHLQVKEGKPSFSLPGSPFTHRTSKHNRISLKNRKPSIRNPTAEQQPLVPTYLENLNLPYADDSNAVTPSSDDLCNLPSHKFAMLMRRGSFASSLRRKLSDRRPSSRRSSYASVSSRTSRGRASQHSPVDKTSKLKSAFYTENKGHHLLPEVIVDQTKLDGDNESSASDRERKFKGKDNQHSLACRTPSATNLDPNDMMVLKDLLDHASGVRRKSYMSILSMQKEPLKDKFVRVTCGWEYPPCYNRFREIVGFFILDPFVDLFITLCILANTAFMAADGHGLSKSTKEMLEDGNQVFGIIFACEAFMKILAMTFSVYVRDPWNCFDLVIVLLSFLELALDGVQGLSVLRTFRLLRVFKLAKSWPTLNMLIRIVASTLGALGNLTLVLGIVVFIFAVMGQQLFSKEYGKYEGEFGEPLPRWNFVDFFHSFMIVFRVLCGEWIDSMWGCMRVASWPCVPFFLLTMVIGNLVVLNLFLALLLASFGAESLSTGDDEPGEPNKLAQAIDRFKKFGNWVKVKLIVCVKKTKEKKQRPVPPSTSAVCLDVNGKNGVVADGAVIGNGSVCDNLRPEENGHVSPTTKTGYDGDFPDGQSSEGSTRPASRASVRSRKSTMGSESGSTGSSASGETHSLKKVDPDGEPEINEVDVEFREYPDDCFCQVFTKRCPTCYAAVENSKFGQKWWALRCKAFQLVEHKYFETFIITMILSSSLALALEDINLPERKILSIILKVMDKFFTVVFILEMIVKWLAFGWKKYYTDAWCWLDFIIVAISIIMLAAEGMGMGEVGAFKAMRTLRALRPLRAVSRWEGMRVVVNALIKAIPSIGNVLMVCLVFWLIFSIVGVQLYSGKFYKCMDEYGNKLDPEQMVLEDWYYDENGTLITNTTLIEALVLQHSNDTFMNITANTTRPFNATRQWCENEGTLKGYEWKNSDINFDNVLNGYLALFQVATYKGWIEIMNDAIDITAVDQQPEQEISILMYLFFVLFIIFGSFFTLNLFIGVIIENFNQQKKKAGGSLEMFMTEDQKKYYKAMKRMQNKSPIKAIPRPKAGSLEMFMTEDQKKYYNAMKRMQSKSPQKSIPRPTIQPAAFIFDMVTDQKFDIVIMVVILLNMITMMMEHYGQTAEFTTILSYINMVFIAVFTLEGVLKLIGLRWYYFKIPWNVFDFVVVVLSLLGIALAEYIEKYFVSPTLLRVVRVFRVGRVLRLVKSAKGIRTLLFALAVSLPALFNIGLLLFLVLFIYAIFGMNFFMHVKLIGGLDDVFNFQTFGQSIITLFQMCTSAGWDGVLIALMNEEDCDPDKKPYTDCGSYSMAVLYLVTYLIMSFLVVVNMYIAVILENFSQATEDVQQGLTPEDFDMYYEKWEKYDPKATKYIPLDQLSDFVDYLEEPLQIPKPNYFMLVKMDIPICDGDMCYCRDILDALTKNFLGTADTGDIPEMAGEGNKEEVEYKPISSTLLRQKEHYAARIIQKAFRNYRKNRDDRSGGSGDIRKPPPYDEVAIQISAEKDEEDKRQKNEIIDQGEQEKKNKTEKKEEEKKEYIREEEEKANGETQKSENDIPDGEVGQDATTPAQSDHTTVEIELRPDSDVVA